MFKKVKWMIPYDIIWVTSKCCRILVEFLVWGSLQFSIRAPRCCNLLSNYLSRINRSYVLSMYITVGSSLLFLQMLQSTVSRKRSIGCSTCWFTLQTAAALLDHEYLPFTTKIRLHFFATNYVIELPDIRYYVLCCCIFPFLGNI